MARVSGSKIIVDSFICAKGTVAVQEVDLTGYQGQVVRVYLDERLNIRVNPHTEQFWQLAEVNLPPAQSVQAQQGTRSEIREQEIFITRGVTLEDVVDGITGAVIVRAGFPWQRYEAGVDYQQTLTGVKWPGGRKPAKGDSYPVTLQRTKTVPNMINQEVPLDLTQVSVTWFPLPK